MISYINNGSSFVLKDKRKIITWIKNLCQKHHTELGELNVILCGDEEILQANIDFLKHDYLTDIITFDYRQEEIIAGDLYLGISTIKENAKEYKTTTQEEVKRVIAHGVLHIIGFNDKNEAEQEEMTRQEDFALKMYNDTFHVKHHE